MKKLILLCILLLFLVCFMGRGRIDFSEGEFAASIVNFTKTTANSFKTINMVLKELHLSQVILSKEIRKLEIEIELLKRGERGEMKITPNS
ncbi:MAG TPA: hypothetical protein ENI23_00480 [bacterium]|nr:hypothetical protein [bacterium]